MQPNHILLVDDDPLLRRSVALSLERAGRVLAGLDYRPWAA